MYRYNFTAAIPLTILIIMGSPAYASEYTPHSYLEAATLNDDDSTFADGIILVCRGGAYGLQEFLRRQRSPLARTLGHFINMNRGDSEVVCRATISIVTTGDIQEAENICNQSSTRLFRGACSSLVTLLLSVINNHPRNTPPNESSGTIAWRNQAFATGIIATASQNGHGIQIGCRQISNHHVIGITTELSSGALNVAAFNRAFEGVSIYFDGTEVDFIHSGSREVSNLIMENNGHTYIIITPQDHRLINSILSNRYNYLQIRVQTTGDFHWVLDGDFLLNGADQSINIALSHCF